MKRIGIAGLVSLALAGMATVAMSAGNGAPRATRSAAPQSGKGGAGQIAVTVRRFVVPSEAVARIAQTVGLDLDGLTGAVVLTPEETTRLVSKLSSEPSGAVMGEGSCLGPAGVEAAARSTRTMTYEVRQGGEQSREVGSMCSVLPEIGGQGLIGITMSLNHVACEGSVSCGRGKAPLFEVFFLSTSCALRNGGSILLRGARSTHWRISRAVGKKGVFPADYFVVVTAHLPAGKPTAPEEPNQVFVAYRMFDLGPKAIKGLLGIVGADGGEAAAILTVQQYRNLDRLIRQSADSAQISLASLVAKPAQEAVIKWIQEDIYDSGNGTETGEIGCVFTALARPAPKGNGVSVQASLQLVLPVQASAQLGLHAKPAVRHAQDSFTIAVPLTEDVEPDQVRLLPVAVPEGFLKQGHRCYMVLTARMLGSSVPLAATPTPTAASPAK